jgi:hypothetical protein
MVLKHGIPERWRGGEVETGERRREGGGVHKRKRKGRPAPENGYFGVICSCGQHQECVTSRLE